MKLKDDGCRRYEGKKTCMWNTERKEFCGGAMFTDLRCYSYHKTMNVGTFRGNGNIGSTLIHTDQHSQ